jgi:hypothetical protein
MPDRLAVAYQINVRLQAALARMETPTTTRRILPVMRHRVEGQIVADVALPRYLVWRSYIMGRVPTHASVVKAIQRFRGLLLWRAARYAQEHGEAPPLMDGVTLPGAIPDTAISQRLDASDTLFWDDPAAWWEQYGDVTRLRGLSDALAAISDEVQQALAGELDDGTISLAYEAWLQDVPLTDMQVLQLVETYWREDASATAGRETLNAMGIAGDFTLEDPVMMDFLRTQAGAFITDRTNFDGRIDATVRQQLADLLYTNLMGDDALDIAPMSVDQLARGIMAQFQGKIAGMSDYRARLIAITETARSETFGQWVAMLGSGVQQKQWMITEGACIRCEGNASMGPIPIQDQFPSGDYAPPLHPGCRCSLAPWVDATFDPNQWSYTPSVEMLASLFDDPALDQWPNGGLNLDFLQRARQAMPQDDAAWWAMMVRIGKAVGTIAGQITPIGAHLDEMVATLTAADVEQFTNKLTTEIRKIA